MHNLYAVIRLCPLVLVGFLVAGCGSPPDRMERRDGGSSEVTRLSANDEARLGLAKAHVALRLEPEQEHLWQAYERAALALLDTPRAERASTAAGPVEKIAQRSNAVRQRAGAFEQLHEAAGKLYSALSPEQKKTADRVLAATLPPAY